MDFPCSHWRVDLVEVVCMMKMLSVFAEYYRSGMGTGWTLVQVTQPHDEQIEAMREYPPLRLYSGVNSDPVTSSQAWFVSGYFALHGASRMSYEQREGL